jgi:uncharacterized protein (DUF885 family)
MTVEEAADMLVREVGMAREAAINEARTYTYCPTCYLSYFIGKLAILHLLHEVKQVMKERFSFKFFHNTLLYAGCLPIPFMRREIRIRMKEEYGIDMPEEPSESLVEFALRIAKQD